MKNKAKLFILLTYLSHTSLCPAESLKQAVEKAIQCHPEIQQSTLQQVAAGEQVREAMGSYYPTVEINGGYGREKTESPFTQDLENTDSIILNRQELAGSVTQNLFSGGAVVNEVKKNKFNYYSLRYRKINTASDIALEVADAYMEVLLQQKIIAISKENLNKHLNLFKLIEHRVNAGITRKADVSQSEARIDLARANLINAEGNYNEAKIRFKKLVGNLPGQLSTPPLPSAGQIPVDEKSAIALSMTCHPLMNATLASIDEARAQHKIANASFYPKVDAVVSVGRNRNLDGLEGKNFDNLGAIRFTYNAFKGGADMANSRKTAYQIQEAIEVRSNTIIDIKESVRLAYNAWKINQRQEVVYRKYVTNVRKTKEAYFEQFKIGQRSLLDLLNVQNEEYTAEVDYLKAEKDEKYARYKILNSTGKLLPYLASLHREAGPDIIHSFLAQA